MTSSVRIARGALVCDGALLAGDITIGATTVVFPGAKIQCLEGAGPVTIGNGCVVEEGASIVNTNPGEMHIGVGNLFEVGCTVHAKKVGFGCLGRAAGGMARIYICSQYLGVNYSSSSISEGKSFGLLGVLAVFGLSVPRDTASIRSVSISIFCAADTL